MLGDLLFDLDVLVLLLFALLFDDDELSFKLVVSDESTNELVDD